MNGYTFLEPILKDGVHQGYLPVVGRWTIGREGSQGAHWLTPDDSSMDDPLLMLNTDGTGIAVNAELFVGVWEVMYGALGNGPLIATAENSKALNYYYHDYVGRLTIDESGAATYVPDKPHTKNGSLHQKRRLGAA